MLPFAIMNPYGNILPKKDIKIYSHANGFLVHNISNGDLYGTSVYGYYIGINNVGNIPTLTLTATNVKRVFGANNNSNNGHMYQSNDNKIYVSGIRTPITGEPSTVSNTYQVWTDITNMFTTAGIIPDNIVDISGYYNLKWTVITNDGSVYCVGKNNNSSQSSFGNSTNVDSFNAFTKINNFPAGTQIVRNAGNYYLSSTGILYGTGTNANYQLGNNSTTSITGLLQIRTGVSDVYTGYQNCYAIDTNNSVYGCGTQFGQQYGNEFGSGGSTTSPSLVVNRTFQLMSTDCKYFSCCVGNMATHIIKSDNILYSTGNNALYQMGNGNNNPLFVYTSIINVSSDAQLVRSNVGSLLFTDGKLYYSGRNDNVIGPNLNTFSSTFTLSPVQF